MKYNPLSSNLYSKNRKNFMTAMQANGLAIFNSNDIYPISADSTLSFEQHRDIFYLSGVDQEESILLLFPNAKDADHREILFLKETNRQIAVWEGEKLSQIQAAKLTGIKTIYWLEDFEKIFTQLAAQCDTFYFNTVVTLLI